MSNTIQPQELRLGNILSFHSKIEKVIELSEDWIVLSISDKVPLTAIGLSAIPLTEEILVKCGFVKSVDLNWKYQLGVGGINMYCRYNTEWYFELGGIYMGSRPKYLNELQNIFHAITGRELEIKL